jgi:flavin-dependent dehydrogenase
VAGIVEGYDEMESYDVIIVGGGPAGLRCAEVLGSTSFSVLLLDKKGSPGPKTCAGGLRLPEGFLTLPNQMTSTFKRHHFILNGKEYAIVLKHPLHIIDRPDLGRYQIDLIGRHKNITIHTGASVKDIDNNRVVLEGHRKIHFRYLVGADGSYSVVRKYLGLENRIYSGVQYIVPGTHDKVVWFFNPDLLGSGYGWVFPHKTFTSAGVFFNRDLISAKRARGALDKLLLDYGLDYRAARLEAAPVNCLYKGVKFGNIFLAGDAAGLASACTGEGIVYALTSGEDVARHMLDKTYSFEGIRKMIRYKKRQEFILSMFDGLPRFQTPLFKIFISLLKWQAFQTFYSGDF